MRKQRLEEGSDGGFSSASKKSELLILPASSSASRPVLGHGGGGGGGGGCICQPSSSGSASSSSSAEARVLAALKIHSVAEKKRRERINAHLSTLRRMIPNAAKMDKASLLGRVIEQLRDLRRKGDDISRTTPAVPSEANQLTVVECDVAGSRLPPFFSGDHRRTFVKATLCCDDRPELFSDLNQAVRNLGLTPVRAELTSLGGRARIILLLCRNFAGEQTAVSSSLVESIRQAMARVAS